MDSDDIIKLYLRGQWRQLPALLEAGMGAAAASGDIAGLSRALSCYGIIHLIWSNDYYISTVYKQIREEYRETGEDPRRKASYARFLALYHAFYGTAATAAQYYREAGLAYRETDWLWDEACALLESIYWLSLFRAVDLPPYPAIGRLEVINNALAGVFTGELRFIHSLLTYPKLTSCVSLFQQHAAGNYPSELSVMALILISFLKMRERFGINSANTLPLAPTLPDMKSDIGSVFREWPDCPLTQLLEGMANAGAGISAGADRPDRDSIPAPGLLSPLKAKAELFKHPWYQTQINRIGEPLDYNSNPPHLFIRDDSGLDSVPAPSVLPGIAANLFGKSQICRQNRMVNLADLPSKTGAAFLLYLLTRPNLQAHRETLAELFFPNEEPAKAFNRLYVNIHRLNQTLRRDIGLPEGLGLILIRQGIVTINAGLFEEVDTQKFQTILSVANQLWATRVSADQEAAVEMIHTAARLFSPDIAPGFYYLDWLDDYRLELKNMQIKAFHRLFQFYRDRQNAAACSEAFNSIIELDPLNENTIREYLEFLLSGERRVEAIHLYRQYEKRLQKELGLTPSHPLQNLLAWAGGA